MRPIECTPHTSGLYVRSAIRLRFFYLLTHEISRFFMPGLFDLHRILTQIVENPRLIEKCAADPLLLHKINKIKTFLDDIKDCEPQNDQPATEETSLSSYAPIENLPAKFDAALGEYFKDENPSNLNPQQRRVMRYLCKNGIFEWMGQVLEGFGALTVQLIHKITEFNQSLTPAERTAVADLMKVFRKFSKETERSKQMALLAKFYELEYA